ncbi:MAG: transcriptional regulator [Microlunatus sp.]|nr:transcriptional regulator [Microlunatus sp.]MDN5771771.1 transcriptional regulator [Microlunatus sp.]
MASQPINPSSTPPAPTDERVFFRDVKPYAIVDDLDQLRGPAGGVVELSHSVLWAPGGPYVDLDEPGGRGLAYRAVLAEGTVEDLAQILNRDQLIAAWPELMLPRRVREMWESRFPELPPATAA